MLRQSFSVDNLMKIFYNENRKGNYTERKFFEELSVYTQQVIEINSRLKSVRIEYREERINASDYHETKNELEELKVQILKEKETVLKELVENVVKTLSKDSFQIQVQHNFDINGKAIYTIKKNPESFFAVKQLQNNLRNSFKIKQANRFNIVNQVKNILNDSFPKYIIRTDLQGFYESIPIDKLKEIINYNSLLGYMSKKHLWKIIDDYQRLSGNVNGIPRGIGISAYLSELYMKDIDNSIRNLPDVTYYARYVDDIIIVFTPRTSSPSCDYFETIQKIIEEGYGLRLHPVGSGKTSLYDKITTQRGGSITYLGYKFVLNNDSISVKLSNNKVRKYKSRIDLAINKYNSDSKYNEKKARKSLVNRLKFMTGNTRLLNVKKNVLVGIYFSNNSVTGLSDFTGLDRYLSHKINNYIVPYPNLDIDVPKLKTRLEKYSFEKGFSEKIFNTFSKTELEEITKLWK